MLENFFTAILNARVVTFIESNNLLGEEQAGFRAGYSTLDHIFTLHSILEWYLRVIRGYIVPLLTTKRHLTWSIDRRSGPNYWLTVYQGNFSV